MKTLVFLDIGGGKTNIVLKNNDESPPDSDAIEQRIVEKADIQGRTSPNIPDPPYARQDDTPLLEDNGQENTAGGAWVLLNNTGKAKFMRSFLF